MNQHSAQIQLPFMLVYNHFSQRIYEPERYTPSIQRTEILENNPDFVLRRTHHLVDEQAFSVLERVELTGTGAEEGEQTSITLTNQLLEHPTLSGKSVWKVVELGECLVEVTCALDWGTPSEAQALVEQVYKFVVKGI